MAVGDVYRLSIVGVFGLGQRFVNTLHYRDETGAYAAAAENLAKNFETQHMSKYLDLLMDSSLVQRIEVRQVTGSPLQAWDEPVGSVGVNAGDQLPPQVCGLIRYKTGLVGRNQHGRNYIPAPAENVNDAGQVATVYRDNMETYGAAVLTVKDPTLTVDDFVLVIYHRSTSTNDQVTSAIAAPDFKSQRRRQIGVGI